MGGLGVTLSTTCGLPGDEAHLRYLVWSLPRPSYGTLAHVPVMGSRERSLCKLACWLACGRVIRLLLQWRSS